MVLKRVHKRLEECPPMVSHKRVPVSKESAECSTRVPNESVPRECPIRVSNIVWLFVFKCLCAFEFVGSILCSATVTALATSYSILGLLLKNHVQ